MGLYAKRGSGQIGLPSTYFQDKINHHSHPIELAAKWGEKGLKKAPKNSPQTSGSFQIPKNNPPGRNRVQKGTQNPIKEETLFIRDSRERERLILRVSL